MPILAAIIFICNASCFGCFCVKSFVFLSHKIQEHFWNCCPIYSLIGYNSPNQYCVGVHLAQGIVIFSANGSHLLSHTKIKERFILFIPAINSACSLCRKKVIKGSIFFFWKTFLSKSEMGRGNPKNLLHGGCLQEIWLTIICEGLMLISSESFLQFYFYTLGTSLWAWCKFTWTSALVSIDVL